MDIQGSSQTAEVAGVSPGRAEAFESSAAERREVEEIGGARDSERSDTREGIGSRIDIEA